MVCLRVSYAQEAERYVLENLNQSFAVPDGASFYDDFPVWNPDLGAHSETYAWLDGDAWVSALKLRKVSWSARPASRLLILGAVWTHPFQRGRGHASRLIESVLELQRPFDAALLWTAEPTLYERLGFKPWREVIVYPFQKDHVAAAELQAKIDLDSWTCRAMDGRKAFSFRLKTAFGFQMKPADLRWYESHVSVKWFHLSRRASKGAYVACGRGIDLQGLIHEWGGDHDCLKAMLPYLGLLTGAEGLLISPDDPLLEPLGDHNQAAAPLTLPMAYVYPSIDAVESSLAGSRPWIWGLDAS